METVMIAAISLDGFIARHDESGVSFTSNADQRWFASIRRTFDCTVMGRKTYSASREEIRGEIECEVEARLRLVLTRRPELLSEEAVAGALEFTDTHPQALVESLRGRGFSRCAVMGGGSVYRSFLAEGCVDWLWLTVEPRLFGEGTALIEGRLDAHFQLEKAERIGRDTLLLKYRHAQ